jgi:REP element-mobilizing transposase RayT
LRGLIAEIARSCDVRIYAYCLMTNHFHLLVEVGGVSLSKFMQRLQTAWSKRFNIRRGRWGHVIQDRFKSRLCDSDAYFKWLLRYIHRNPVKARMVTAPGDWPWSSYGEYAGTSGKGICEVDWPLSLFATDAMSATEAFLTFVAAGADDDSPPPKLFDSHRQPLKPLRPRSPESAVGRPALEELVGQAAVSARVAAAGIKGGSRVRTVCAARRALVTRAFLVGYSLTEIAKACGITVQAASRLLRQSSRTPRPADGAAL